MISGRLYAILITAPRLFVTWPFVTLPSRHSTLVTSDNSSHDSSYSDEFVLWAIRHRWQFVTRQFVLRQIRTFNYWSRITNRHLTKRTQTDSYLRPAVPVAYWSYKILFSNTLGIPCCKLTLPLHVRSWQRQIVASTPARCFEYRNPL